MKKLFSIVLLLTLFTGSAYTKEVNYPYDDFKLQNTYQINDGKTVYIEQTPVGHTIWVKDKSSKELNKISNVWFFLGISKECEGEKLNVLFATQKEYYMWGGIDFSPSHSLEIPRKNQTLEILFNSLDDLSFTQIV